MTDPIVAVIRAVLRAGAAPAKKRMLQSHQAVKILKDLGLAGAAADDNFRSVYARTIAFYCTYKPDAVVKLFADEWVRAQFERSHADGNWRRVHVELREALERNRETKAFGQLHQADLAEIDGFIAEFGRQVAATRTPAHVASDRQIGQLAGDVGTVLGHIEKITQRQEEYRQKLDPARGELSSLERLSADIGEWLAALKYAVLDHSADRSTWIVKAPITPGRYGRVVILGVDGELQPSHIRQAMRAKQDSAANGAWVVAQRRISPAAREAAARDGSILCLTFDDLVDMAADFEPYVDWLDQEVERLGLASRYVRLSCRRDDMDEGVFSDYDWRTGGLDEYAQRWIADPAKEHLSVIGAFGSGKSWFSLHLAWQLAKLWREARDRGLPRPRLPLLIPLRDYAKAADVGAVVSKFLYERDLRLGMPFFEYLNRTGRLLLIFDGFDEMAARVDRQTMVSNFWELAKVVQPGAKVLLSSRTEHFPTADEARQVLTGEVHAAVAPPVGEAPRFDIVELLPLDDEQVRLVLGARTDDQDVIDLVTGDHQLLDLLRRPVMSDLVLTALPEIRAGDPVDIARIYLYAIRHKLDEDIRAERTFTSRADKLYFLCELAWEMISKSELSLNFRSFPDRLREYFGATIAAKREFDHWVHDMQAQTLLIRDGSGDYKPAHRSLLEWFVAFKFAGELGVLDGQFLDLLNTVQPDATGETWSGYFTSRAADGSLPPLGRFAPEPMHDLARTFGRMSLDSAVVSFLQSMIAAHPQGVDRVLEIARGTADAPAGESAMIGANCLITVAALRSDLPLAGAVLTGLDARRVRSLDGADLRGADLRDSELHGISMIGADLTGAYLTGTSLLAGDTLVNDVVVTPSGAIAVKIAGRLESWADGDLAAAGRVLLETHGVSLIKTVGLVALRGSLAYCGSAGPGIVDLETGERTAAPTIRWAVPVMWQGLPALLLDSRDTRVIEVLSRADLTSIGRLPAPPGRRRVGLNGLAYLPDLGICSVTRSGDDLTVESFAGAEGWTTTATWPIDPESSSWTVDGYVWVETASGKTEMYDLRGEPVWSPTETIIRFRPDGAPLFLVSESHRSLVLPEDEQLVAWPLPGGPPRWKVSIPRGAYHLVSHPDGDSFVYAAASGEIGRRRLDTGELISRTSLNKRFRGTRLSRGCGLSDEVLDVLELSGAVIQP